MAWKSAQHKHDKRLLNLGECFAFTGKHARILNDNEKDLIKSSTERTTLHFLPNSFLINLRNCAKGKDLPHMERQALHKK